MRTPNTANRLNRRTFTGAALATLAAATAAGAVAVPAQAAGRTHCDFDAVTRIALVQPAADANGGFNELFLDQGRIMFRDAVGSDFCYGPQGQIATDKNTASILFVGTPGKDDFIISQAGGRFGGGAPGGDDPTQIETTVLSDSQDILDIAGTDQPDSIGIVGGPGTGKQGGVVTFLGGSGKPTVKVTNAPSMVRVNGLNGFDTISGSGMFGTPTTMHLQLAGGSGPDYMEGGLLAGDRLQGDDGDDRLFTREGQPGDIVSGGLGFDHATVDLSDQATGIEKFDQAIGTLKLAPAAVMAKDRAATIRLSWTHPTGWKKLESVSLVAYDGTQRVGSVTMSPKTRQARRARRPAPRRGREALPQGQDRERPTAAQAGLRDPRRRPAPRGQGHRRRTATQQVEPSAGRLVAASRR